MSGERSEFERHVWPLALAMSFAVGLVGGVLEIIPAYIALPLVIHAAAWSGWHVGRGAFPNRNPGEGN